MADLEPRRGVVSLAFGLTCGAYLAATTAEALLAAVIPEVAEELDLDVAQIGWVLAVLAASIAIGTLVGGLAVRRLQPGTVAAAGLALTACGCGLAAVAGDRASFVVSQLLIGVGAGLLWPAAVLLVGRLVEPEGRGLAMGIFGTAFSGGLVVAALLGAAGQRLDWRVAFAASAALAGVAAVAVASVRVAVTGGGPDRLTAGLRGVLGLPSLVGVVAGISQYATVSFLPIFAVEVWALSAGGAALVLAVGRVLSIPLKVAVGALADRVGPEGAVAVLGAVLGASGALWVLPEGRWPGAVGAVAFAAAVSGLFPLANVLALDRSGQRGAALGVFRAVQIGAGSLVGLTLGFGAGRYGLRPTIAVAALAPAVLVVVAGRRKTSERSAVSAV